MHRRELVKLASWVCLSAGAGLPAWAEDISSLPKIDISHADIADQLIHCTVRIRRDLPDGRFVSGTGFLFLFLNGKDTNVPVLISNKHVFRENFTEACTLIFTATKGDGSPDYGNNISLNIENLSNKLIDHPSPDVDLIIIPINQTLEYIRNVRKQQPYVIFLRPENIPDNDTMQNLDAIEDVITLGYPGQLWDSANNLPILHRGITASPPNIDFQGQKKFIIDIATWPGSSGSPVFVYNDGAIHDRKTNAVSFGTRLLLIGVVYAVAVYNVDGQVTIKEAPTSPPAQTPLTATSQVPMNIGLCFKASLLFDFEPLLVSIGGTLPPDYKMRSTGK